MKHSYILILIVALLSCHSTKKISEKSSNQNAEVSENDSDLEFGCYYPSDTIENLVLYFPEEKRFFVNGNPGNIDDLCITIQADINRNKGAKYYLDPQSNFMYAMTIIRKTKKCYLEKIDEISVQKYGLKYEALNPEQQSDIDSILSYRVIGEE